MTLLDLALLALLLAAVLRGWQSGFLHVVSELMAWLLSLVLAFRLYDRVGAWLGPWMDISEVFARPLAFGVTAFGLGITFSLLLNGLLAQLPARLHRNPLNRLLGLLPGLVNGAITLVILATLLANLPLPAPLERAVAESRLVDTLAPRAAPLREELTPIFGDALSQTLDLMTVHPDSDELIELPYTVVDARAAPALEEEMLALVNRERAAAGLPALTHDPSLREVARRHSADMFARGYFSHATPEGLTPYDRIEAAGVRYLIAGENLAHAATLTIAHGGLMNSPGHRENILRPEFGRIGIGIVDGGSRGLMVTQNFRD